MHSVLLCDAGRSCARRNVCALLPALSARGRGAGGGEEMDGNEQGTQASVRVPRVRWRDRGEESGARSPVPLALLFATEAARTTAVTS